MMMVQLRRVIPLQTEVKLPNKSGHWDIAIHWVWHLIIKVSFGALKWVLKVAMNSILLSKVKIMVIPWFRMAIITMVQRYRIMILVQNLKHRQSVGHLSSLHLV
ncbi:hypothetical protein D3C73_1374050 [compost metagenome]